jgi:hypothetical protein
MNGLEKISIYNLPYIIDKYLPVAWLILCYFIQCFYAIVLWCISHIDTGHSEVNNLTLALCDVIM